MGRTKTLAQGSPLQAFPVDLSVGAAQPQTARVDRLQITGTWVTSDAEVLWKDSQGSREVPDTSQAWGRTA